MRTLVILSSFLLLSLGANAGAESLIKATPLTAQKERVNGAPLFVALTPEQSGIAPVLKHDEKHPLSYLIGSGMEASGTAAGDVDGDGLPDLFIASEPGNNRLYRQVAPLKFEDITQGSGLEADHSWTRGASIVDIDNDGDRDIYVANYGEPNRLYINEGAKGDVPVHFVERADAYGLALVEASLMPAFCDYDADGDLDLYLVTGEFLWPSTSRPPDEKKMIGERNGKPVINPPFDKFFRLTAYRKSPDGVGFQVKWDKAGRPDFLYRNNGDGTFSNVTTEAGLRYDSGRGLSAAWWDYDDDGHPDLYVANDWGDRDFLYRNNGDGTFTDMIEQAVPSTTMYSMGADIGDLNGDGLLDLMVADMSGTTHYKRKVSMGSMMASTTEFMANARPPQNMRNAVLLGTGTPRLLEAANMMGLANTDWSWAVKLADLDNDGRCDVFVTNGMERNIRQIEGGEDVGGADLSSEKNLALRNQGDYHFSNMGAEWGLDHFGFSLAALTCDFDRDGDLDAFVINRDEMPILSENRSVDKGLLVRLRGKASNTDGLGAMIRLETTGGIQVQQMRMSRGYLSSDEAVVHFGLGGNVEVTKLRVDWPSGHRQAFTDVRAGNLYEISEPGGEPTTDAPVVRSAPLFVSNDALASVVHQESSFDEFAIQPLLPNQLSRFGPGIAVGDLDGDGDDDFVLGGALGQATQVVMNNGKGAFADPVGISGSEAFEDMGLLLFDADGDGDSDLYAVSGSVETDSAGLRDRLYLNDGSAKFSAAPDGALPRLQESGGPVAAADVDRDGDLDVFVGGRVVPGNYPVAANSRLLINEGGTFSDGTANLAPFLKGFGLVTGCVFSDIDDDGWQDLVVAREWGAPAYLRNDEGKLVDRTKEAGLSEHTGWWNGIATGDVDGDGDIDFVATNFGLNMKYHASEEHPALLYYGSFGTDKMRLVEAEFEEETLFPVRGKVARRGRFPILRASSIPSTPSRSRSWRKSTRRRC